MKIIVEGPQEYLEKVKEDFFSVVLPAEIDEIKKEIEEKNMKEKPGIRCKEEMAVIAGKKLVIKMERHPDATGAFIAKRLSGYIADRVLYTDRILGEKTVMEFNDGKLMKVEKLFSDPRYTFEKIEPDSNGQLKVEHLYRTA